MPAETLRIPWENGGLSAELTRPDVSLAVLVLAHGAGAGFRHASLEAISESLTLRGVATLRFNFPFMEAGRRRVDGKAASVAAVAAAASSAAERLPDLPLYLGGHSFGGRMATHAVAEHAVTPRGVVCLSFPLHPAGRPDVARAAHLSDIRLPMLFLSGTRDDLAQSGLLEAVVSDLHDARLHWLEDADHGYRARKRVRQEPRTVFDEIGDEVRAFIAAGSGA